MPFIGNKPTAVPLTSADLGDGIVTSAKIANGTIIGDDINSTFDLTGKTVTGAGGITDIDMWRLNSNLNGDQTPIASNLERVDTDGFALLGTGMSEASGIFTFPNTGYWEIIAHFQFSSDAIDNQKTGFIQTTTDNSTYDDASHCVANFYSGSVLASANTNFIFYVSNTSTHKVRFRVSTMGSSDLGSDTNANFTFFTFKKLA